MNDLGAPFFAASYVVLWLLVVVLAITVVAQLHYMGVMFKALDPLVKFKTPDAMLLPGEKLPSARLVDEFGGIWNPADGRRPRVLLFVNLTCKPCENLLNGLIERLQAPNTPQPTRELVLVVGGERQRARDFRARHSIPPAIAVFADPGADSIQRWGVKRTPTAIPIDASSRILSFVESPTLASILELMGLPTAPEEDQGKVAIGTVYTRTGGMQP